ncbi:MAG: retron Eco8 family effector endonuclease [Candidatus Muirbacterium halophilum]|nr:retron Eco8 family effector endonuclease [Candidatus Muirbacterium halophilum]
MNQKLVYIQKKNEKLIYDLFNVYTTYKKTRKEKEEGKYNTPYPKIIFSTHSPNIVKEVIRLFDTDQQILHFSKNNKENTAVQKMNSIYDNKRFLNIFSDNEARLFFSDFILFVEGATEQEVFSNRALVEKFKIMQDIDVYATNELVLKYINPSYANTSIPYLVLYDADKLITIDIDNKKLDFNKFTINIVSYFNLYKKSYIGSKQKFLYNLLKQLLEWKKSIILEFDSNLYIKNINYSLFIKYVNDVFLAQENYILNKTTIEEVLINNDSFYLFKRWLIYEYQTNIYKSMNNKIPTIEKNKIIIAKTKNMKNFKKFINTKFATKREVTTAFILVFSGKTETSITTSTKNYNKIDSNFIENINKIKETYLSNSLNLGYLLGKTSGWVTSFLNFSINKIENNIEKKQFENQIDKDKEFRIEFKKYFGELYDTISIIENKY